MNFDYNLYRQEFPILERKINQKDLIYFDNAATTLKPKCMMEEMQKYYLMGAANIHRAVHTLGEEATLLYENSRKKVAQYIGAKKTEEIIFTKGTTEAMNLLATSLGLSFLKEGDEVLISQMEHHSNIVPWQLLREHRGIKLKIIPMNLKGEILIDEYKKMLGPQTKIVSVVWVSNSLGTINPIKEMIDLAHQNKSLFIVDAAQAVAHMKVDVTDLDCDFLAFSAHKIYGPTGLGVLYGKEKLLEKMPPYQGGGDMISSVTFEKTTFNTLPYKFEAGTPPIAEVISLKAALEFVEKIGLEAISQYEHTLLTHAENKMREIPGISIIGQAEKKASVLSFISEQVHPHDMGTFLDQEGIAIRTGHHCTQPVMNFFDIPATARASFCFYNTKEEIDFFIEKVKKCLEFFA